VSGAALSSPRPSLHKYGIWDYTADVPLRGARAAHKFGAPYYYSPGMPMDAVLNSFMLVTYYALDFYKWIVIVNVVVSWLVAFNVINTSNQLVYLIMDFTYRMTDPVYRRIRTVMPNLGGIDLSPVVVLLGVMFLQSLISQTASRMMM